MGTVLLQVDSRLAALQANEIVSRCESCYDRELDQAHTQHNTRWKVRNSTSGDEHTALEDSLLKYLEETAPAEYLDALRPDYRESVSQSHR